MSGRGGTGWWSGRVGTREGLRPQDRGWRADARRRGACHCWGAAFTKINRAGREVCTQCGKPPR